MLDSEIADQIYSGGIYFVSSIMGLGAKNDAKFIDKSMGDLFENEKNKFLSENGNESGRMLYQYNIMSANRKNKAVEYSQKESNVIYANSGLLCLEKEMETFAGKYLAYQKFQMIYEFLNRLNEQLKAQLEEKASELKEYKDQNEGKIESGRQNIQKEMMAKSIDMEKEFLFELDQTRKKYIQYIKKQVELLMVSHKLGDSKHQRGGIFAKKDVRAEQEKKEINEQAEDKLLQEFEKGYTQIMFQAIKKRIALFHELDNEQVADELMQEFQKTYTKIMLEAKKQIYCQIVNCWLEDAKILKKEFAKMSKGDEDYILDFNIDYLRNEIDKIQESFQCAEINDIIKIDKSKIKKIFLEKYNPMHLDKWSSNFLKYLDKCSSHFLTYINEKMAVSGIAESRRVFMTWRTTLIDVIGQNITEINPELKEIEKEIKRRTSDVDQLTEKQEKIQSTFDSVANKMKWVNIEEEMDEALESI